MAEVRDDQGTRIQPGTDIPAVGEPEIEDAGEEYPIAGGRAGTGSSTAAAAELPSTTAGARHQPLRLSAGGRASNRTAAGLG